MTKWRKQTYEMVAEVLRNARGMDPETAMTLDSLTSSFAEIFRIDSPRFDEVRFRRAAGDELDRPGVLPGVRHHVRFHHRRQPEVRVRPYRRRA